MRDLRVGQGFDVHKFAQGRKLIIGGVEIPFEQGLKGHSDADVLLHAITDALLGAAGLPDIGQHFPPSDEKYKDIDSSELLSKVVEMITKSGFKHIVNVDSVIMAEQPKMGPHILVMRERIASVLGIEIERVNVKATTCEKLGFIGREEGIAASAVCLIARDE